MGGCQDRPVHAPIGSCGSDHHHALDPGCLGGHRVHQHSAGVGRPPTRDVQACCLHRPPAATELFSVNPLHVEVLGLLTLMKILDAAVRQLQGISQVGGSLIPGLTQLCGGDLERIRPETVELLGECHQCRITVVAHPFEDRFNGGSRIPLGCSSGAS